VSKAKLLGRSIGWPAYTYFDYDVEVTNVIIRRPGVPGIYSVDALTERDGWLRALAFACDERDRDDIIRRFVESQQRFLAQSKQIWSNPRETAFVGFGFGGDAVVPCEVVTVSVDEDPDTEAKHEVGNDWVQSPVGILSRLESDDTTEDDRVTAVLFAETTGFTNAQKPRLLRALFEFAKSNRFARNDEVITAVGSAIRKIAMNMLESSFEDYSELLAPTATDTLHYEVELELAKAVGWRLISANAIEADAHPRLTSALSELASDYLTARLILQENYASIVIHAVVAVCLLRGRRQLELIDRTVGLKMDWFSDILARRLAEAANKRRTKAPEDVGALVNLCDRLVASTR